MRTLLRHFTGDRRGNVAMITALAIFPIAVLVGASVDISRMHVERTRLQSAVDAAVLAAANMPSTASDVAVENAVGDFLQANFNGTSQIATFDVERSGSGVAATAFADVPLTFSALLGHDVRRVAAHASAERGGVNLEVALVLDITGSMGIPFTKMVALKAAAKDLIVSLVPERPDPEAEYRTRVAIVPYSNAVNVGQYAQLLRGTPPAPQTISDADWATGSSRTITDATRARPVVVTTSTGHGYQNGDQVYIDGVRGMTQLNGNFYTVRNRTNTTFDLYDERGNPVDGRWYGYFSGWSYGSARKCAYENCEIRVRIHNHGFSDGDPIHITDVNAPGMRRFNNETFAVNRVNNNFIQLTGSLGGGTYNNGGKAWCAGEGCQYFAFTNVSNQPRTFELSACVTERTGPEAYTDAAPGGAPLGRAYLPSSNSCSNAQATPLSENRRALTNQIDALQVSGSTAGQIGIAWGWYMLSPNFASLWPSDNRPVDYRTPETMKIAVIMTDGEFNTAHCNGVVARESGWDAGMRRYVVPDSERINCPADNGDPFQQASRLCDAMKAQGITVYTVAFDVPPNSQAASFMRSCASGSSNAYLASSGAQLQQAFADIGASIGQLRLTR